MGYSNAIYSRRRAGHGCSTGPFGLPAGCASAHRVGVYPSEACRAAAPTCASGTSQLPATVGALARRAAVCQAAASEPDAGGMQQQPGGGSGDRLDRRHTLRGVLARSAGSLLGLMCGDVLGAAVEGRTHSDIRAWHPQGLTEFEQTRRGYGCYTDDTQMAIALAQSLVEYGSCDAVHAARMYAAHYDRMRGYGATARKILEDLRDDPTSDPRTIGTKYIPGGSFANGGAMRIAPLGIAYRNAPPEVLYHAVEEALLCTHTHPVAIDGAYVIASAVAFLTIKGLQAESPDTSASSNGPQSGHSGGTFITPVALLDHVVNCARTEELRSKLVAVRDAYQHAHWVKGRRQTWQDYFAGPGWAAELELQIRADDAVAAALSAVVFHWGRPADAIVAAVHYGGDTDTVGAITGGMVGAMHGTTWIPDRWFANLENGDKGREAAFHLAQRLAQLDVVSGQYDK